MMQPTTYLPWPPRPWRKLFVVFTALFVVAILSALFIHWLSPQPQSMDWKINNVAGDGVVYFTTSDSTVTVGYTCNNMNYGVGKIALRVLKSDTGKEVANLPISANPHTSFCNATSYNGTVVYAPLDSKGATMSGIGAYSGAQLLWAWNLPPSMTAVEKLIADQSGVYALLGNGNTAEIHGIPPTALRLVHLVTGHTTTAKPVVTFNVPIKLGSSGQMPSLTHYAHGLALAYTIDEQRLVSVQYVDPNGTLTAPLTFGSDDYTATSGIALSADGSLFSTHLTNSPQCASNLFPASAEFIRKYDRLTGKSLVDYKLPYPCSTVYSIRPLPNGDMLAKVSDTSFKNWSLVRLKSGGGIVWTKQLNGNKVGIDTKGAIIVENFDESHNQTQIVMIDPTSGSTKVLHTWTLKTSTNNNSVAYLFVGPNRVYAVIQNMDSKGSSNYALYSFYVSGLGESYQG